MGVAKRRIQRRRRRAPLSNTLSGDDLISTVNDAHQRDCDYDEAEVASLHNNGPARPRRFTVLIAEDAPVIRKLARIMLESAGYSTLSASDGRDALAISRAYSGTIDILLSDIDMPRLDGFELRRQILMERPAIKVLFMSAVFELPESPAFLKKPLEANTLLTAVRGLLQSGSEAGPSRTALVLEDDQAPRFVIRSLLERTGFTVMEAAHGPSALEICRTHPKPISLMVADVVLRGPHGPETVRRIKELQPDMAVLFTSGYPLDQVEHRGLVNLQDRAGFVQKPFTSQVFLTAVRKLIG
jgi:CheY-like chemotaxis protein